jgi:hypothetical protein
VCVTPLSILQLINQNQQAFLQLLNEGYEDPQEGGNPDQLPPGVNAIYVTQEEREAIQRVRTEWHAVYSLPCGWTCKCTDRRIYLCVAILLAGESGLRA